MDKRIKDKWVAELRSKKYKQGFDRLKTKGPTQGICHCALGVLVEMFHSETKQGEWQEADFSTIKFSFADRADGTEPLPVVLRWAGLDNSDPLVRDRKNVPMSVMTLNDAKRLSFDAIAEAIEKSTEL